MSSWQKDIKCTAPGVDNQFCMETRYINMKWVSLVRILEMVNDYYLEAKHNIPLYVSLCLGG